MKFLQIHNFYSQYLKSLYSKIKHLDSATHYEQVQLLIDDYFSAAHIISPYMENFGYESRLIIANCAQSQLMWLKENKIKMELNENWTTNITQLQIDEYKPDVLYLSHPIEFDAKFITRLRHKPKLIIGWRAAAFPCDIDWSGFDVMLSSLKQLLGVAVVRGAKAGEVFMPGFPVKLAQKLEKITPSVDIVFPGQYTPSQHANRGYFLQQIAKHALSSKYTCAFFLSGQTDYLPFEINNFAFQPVFGLEMHKALRRGRITFDARANHFITNKKNEKIDIGGNDTANMRIFEATGSGSFLLTEHFPNISNFFEIGKEIETYKDGKELIDKIDFYISHPKERELIAFNGQQRCLKDHSMERRAEWLNQIINKHIDVKEQNICSDTNKSNKFRTINKNFNTTTSLMNGTWESLNQEIRSLVSNYPRRQKGSLTIDNTTFYFADLHSFYFEYEQIFRKKLYSFLTSEEHPIIIDCGAHVGLASIFFSLNYSKAHIYSFEADPDIYNLFIKNIKSIKCENIIPHNKAVWTHDYGVNFSRSGDDSGHISDEGENLPSIRLKNYINNFERVDLLKLDVEGSENDILNDCRHVLHKVKCIIAEIHHFDHKKQFIGSLFKTLEDSGFQYTISDLHSADWLAMGNKPPFDFIQHDKFIMTVFAWRTSENPKNTNTSHRPQASKIKVAQFCMQNFGGAGMAAARLHESLLNNDIESRLYVQNINKLNPETFLISEHNNTLCNNKFISPEWLAFNAVNQHALSKYTNRPTGLEMFSVPWSSTDLSSISYLSDTNLINLHWISGTVSILDNIQFLKNKKIVWTLHDMNPFTGGCHYASACDGYTRQCGKCPQLGSNFAKDLSNEIWRIKKEAYKNLDITIVSPSSWLAKCAKQSTLLGSFPVHVVPNSVPTSIFKPLSSSNLKNSLNINPKNHVILFGADDIYNNRKGFNLLIDSINTLKLTSRNITLCLFGKNANKLLHKFEYETVPLDQVESEYELASIYSMADITALPSIEDNLPNIILESFACGTPVVGFNTGGIPEAIDHKINGYVANKNDTNDFANGIIWAMSTPNAKHIKLKCREKSLLQYSQNIQARKYTHIYKSILAK